jgi:hypothetical protein
MIGWFVRKLLGLKTVDEIEVPEIPDDLPEEEIRKLEYKNDENGGNNKGTCSLCGKPAIGYESHTNCGIMVCMEHASKVTLKLSPGYGIDLLNGKPKSTTQKDGYSYGGYRNFGGYRYRFPNMEINNLTTILK